MRLIAIVFLLAAILARANDAYPSARLVTASTRTNAGVDGGHRRLVTTVYTNITNLGITVAQLETVLNVNCPSNQAVKLTNGTFTALNTAVVRITKSGVV